MVVWISVPIVPTTFFGSVAPMATEENNVTELGNLEKLTIQVDEIIQVPEGIWQSTTMDFEKCLIGRVLSRKSINLEALESTLTGAWDLVKGVKM